MTGRGGWPLVWSAHFPGERALSCPKCGSSDVTMSCGGGSGTGPGGRFRVGDPGGYESNKCEKCGHRHTWRE